MNDHTSPYLLKARQSLQGAESEHANRRFDNAASRAYYAVYQAAVGALGQAGIQRNDWQHRSVQAAFASELITRRKLFRRDLASVIYDLYELRVVADYREVEVSETRSERALRRARAFVSAVTGRGRR